MVASPAAAMLFAVMMVFACAETAAAKAVRPGHPAASYSVSSAQVLRKKPPASPAPRQDEKAWMERASAPSDSAGGGGGM